MDTLYMRERAYRLVEMLRRENRREQRRLDEKLFSKQGLATTHKMELLALTEEQRKIREELSKIRKSSATSWGLLPPRHGEPDFDEEFLRSLTSGRGAYSEKADGLRSQSLGRPPPASYSDDEFHLSDSALQISHPESPDQMTTTHGEPSRPRRLRKQSLIKLDEESRRTKETLKKFNKVFPSDGSPVIMENKSKESQVTKEDQPEPNPRLMPQRKTSRVGLDRSEENETEQDRKASVIYVNKRSMLELNTGGKLTHRSKRRKSMDSNKRIGNPQALNAINRRKYPQTHESNNNMRRPSEVSLSVPKALQYLEDEMGKNGDHLDEEKKTPNPTGSMNMIDVQDARNKIVKRLLGNDSLAKAQKAKAEVPKEIRTLSPIREQRTELSLASQSLPQMVSRIPSNPESSSSKTSKKKKNEGTEGETPKFDSYRYNPDGSLRTMHILPDFSGSLEEAKKARYIRHSEKQWYEKELTVNQIFEDR